MIEDGTGSAMRLKKYRIMHQVALGGPYYRIALETGDDYAQARPGQFVMLRVHPGNDPLLRRPFSICGTRKDSLLILYRVVGKGTSIMAEKLAGERLGMSERTLRHKLKQYREAGLFSD